jgi:hypothetical protein
MVCVLNYIEVSTELKRHRNFQGNRLKYPRVSYTDLDNLICKKSEEEVHSKAEGGEHSEEACAPTCPQ